MNIRKSINIALAQNEKNSKWLQDKLKIKPAGYSSMMCRNQVCSKRLIELAVAFNMKVSEFIALGED